MNSYKMNSYKWYVYIAKCNDDSLYTGISPDPKKRVFLHNSGKGAKSLISKLPVKLVYVEESMSKFEAAKREKAIKNWKRKYKLKLINKHKHKGFTL